MDKHTERIEMSPRELRLLAETMGWLNVVTVTLAAQQASAYWAKRVEAPKDQRRVTFQGEVI